MPILAGGFAPRFAKRPEYISPFSLSPLFEFEKREPDLRGELSLLGLQIREEADLPRVGVPPVVHQAGWYFYPCALPLSLLLRVCVLFLFV
ncbi:hypothetical protein RHMOL_Rhmol10G0132600 [Rhododendron molle]|uniref:Uncharacterized protein n=1 Tax=Rhododendron molle TaxID=49168 RepID=A0ACC0M225_RHOML|nr:hypothetical protein RHMOL_Rhmol10G0132600 [Rhododendron molle]